MIMMQNLPKFDVIDDLATSHFQGNIIRKYYIKAIPEFQKFPAHVTEFLISEHVDSNGILHEDAIKNIINTINLKSFDKNEKEVLKDTLMRLGSVEIVDHFECYTDLRRGKHFTYIKQMDETATVNSELLEPHRFQGLLKGGLWGKAKIDYSKGSDFATANMSGFECYQTTFVILREYIEARKAFTTSEWIDFLIRSLGINPGTFSRKEKLLYLARIIPYVQACTNLLELGPPGTGKSYLYENISNYGRILEGGEITLAKLIYNQNTRRNGVIFYKDVICFDEIDKSNPRLKELLPKLQQIMASNRVERGEMEAITDVSLVFQGNIEFDIKDGKIKPKHGEILRSIPNYLYNAAFLDRIHLFIHGWDLPRYSSDHINKHLGLIFNYFGQILHRLREMEVSTLIEKKIEFYITNFEGKQKTISLRDKVALYNTISGLIKLIFPHKRISKQEWKEIVEFAIELRQNVIDEMEKIDKTLSRKIFFKFKDEIVEDIEKIDDDINKEISEAYENYIQQLEKDIPIILEKLSLNIFNISVNNENYIIKPIPYAFLKVLIEKNKVRIHNNNLLLKNEDIFNFKKIVENKEPIAIKSSNQTININYREEEEGIDQIEKNIENLLNIIEKYFDLQDKINEIKFNSSLLDRTEENNRLLQNIELIYNKILHLTSYNRNMIINQIQQSIEITKMARGISPDLLSYNYFPIILETKKIISLINEKIKLWEKEVEKFSDFENIYNKLYPIIKEKQQIQLMAKKKFGGKKFPFYSFDINNLCICYKQLYPQKYFPESPILKIKKQLLKDKPYLAYFFATAQFNNVLKHIPNNEYNIFYIEKKIKDKSSGKYIDVDVALSGYTLRALTIYRNQISHFYLGSADKDFHILIREAKRFNIPVTLIVANGRFLSIEMEELVEGNVIELYRSKY